MCKTKSIYVGGIFISNGCFPCRKGFFGQITGNPVKNHYVLLLIATHCTETDTFCSFPYILLTLKITYVFLFRIFVALYA